MAMKSHEGRQRENPAIASKWTTYIGDFQFLPSRSDLIKELKDGLKVAQLLDLPIELTCTYEHLCCFLVTNNTITPFKQLKLV